MAMIESRIDSGIAVLEINRPPVNSYTTELLKELDAAVLDARGNPQDIVLEESTTSERRINLLRRSLQSARYSPRYEDGRPVATTGVTFEGTWEALAWEPEEP